VETKKEEAGTVAVMSTISRNQVRDRENLETIFHELVEDETFSDAPKDHVTAPGSKR